VHGQYGFDAPGYQVVEYVSVVRKGCLVVTVSRGLNPSPAWVKSVGIESHLFNQPVVLDGPGETPYSVTDELTVSETAFGSGLGPKVPIRGRVLVFDLRGRGRDSERELAPARLAGDGAGAREIDRWRWLAGVATAEDED